ncbi:MAG: PorV/PorQ family protein [Bacteroidota bacterium]|nr:PorV/PorQ family protein [Bacteroidota bacterium]
MRKLLAYYIFLSALCCSIVTQAQLFPKLGAQRAGISTLTFLKLDISPRAEAMGGAGISSKGDAYASGINPAVITDVKTSSFAVSSKVLSGGLTNSFVGFNYLNKKNNYFGLNMTYLNAGNMEERTVFQPSGTGNYVYAYNMAIGISYAKVLSDFFSLGVSAKYIREQLGQFGANTVGIDLGFLYKTDFKDLRFAVVLQSFGPNSQVKGIQDQTVYYNVNNSTDPQPLSGVFKMGVSMIPYKTELKQLTVELQLNHPNDNAENLALGAEYMYLKVLRLRAGYRVNVKDFDYPTAGIGLNSRIGRLPLTIDYAFSAARSLGIMHNIGFTIQLSNPDNTSTSELYRGFDRNSALALSQNLTNKR